MPLGKYLDLWHQRVLLDDDGNISNVEERTNMRTNTQNGEMLKCLHTRRWDVRLQIGLIKWHQSC